MTRRLYTLFKGAYHWQPGPGDSGKAIVLLMKAQVEIDYIHTTIVTVGRFHLEETIHAKVGGNEMSGQRMEWATGPIRTAYHI